MVSRDAVAALGLLRPEPSAVEVGGAGMPLLAVGGEARLYACSGGGEVRKAYLRQALGKALKELQGLLAAGAHEPQQGGTSPLVRLLGVEWPLDSPRPTALLLEHARTDLRGLLLDRNEQGRRPPLPLRQVLRLALTLAVAVARLHGAGLCHKDIHRCASRRSRRSKRLTEHVVI